MLGAYYGRSRGVPGLARACGGDVQAVTEATLDRHNRTVHSAVRYIHDNLNRPLRVDELARHVHVSPRQLTRLFSKGLNASPASYVERVRLQKAAALLLRTGIPIKQIAANLGYPDVATFTRAFSRQHGQPPGRFRRAGGLSTVLPASRL
jgi:transcriptional regulator GlxA family with amidase domain